MFNYGYNNELDFVKSLNNKRVRFLNPFLKDIVFRVFKESPRSLAKVQAKKLENFEKADISITLNGVTKYISIKSGHSTYIHSCYLKDFILYLREMGISMETQKAIVLYHYGDGTYDGTGKQRYDYQTVISKYRDVIKRANEELADKRIVTKIVDRFVFGADDSQNHVVDYLLMGYIEHGIIVSRQDVLRFVNKKSFGYIIAPHVGPLHLQPYLRDIERRSNNPEKRKIIKLEWKNIEADLSTINNNKVRTNDDFFS